MRDSGAVQIADSHLCARMQHESRQIFAQQMDKPKILHDGGIRTRFIQEAPVRERRRKLLVKQERVKRNVYRNAAGMAIFYRPKKLFIAEIACKATRIECAAPKVYSICTVLYGSNQAFPASRRRKQRHLYALLYALLHFYLKKAAWFISQAA